jgi:hypothetical protein
MEALPVDIQYGVGRELYESRIAERAERLAGVRVRAKELAIPVLLHLAGCEIKHCLCRGFLAGEELKTVELEEEDSYDEAGTFIPIDKGWILDDTCRVFRCKYHGVGGGVSQMIPRTRQCGVKKSFVAQPFAAAVLGELSVMDRLHKRSIDPGRIGHLLRT